MRGIAETIFCELSAEDISRPLLPPLPLEFISKTKIYDIISVKMGTVSNFHGYFFPFPGMCPHQKKVLGLLPTSLLVNLRQVNPNSIFVFQRLALPFMKTCF